MTAQRQRCSGDGAAARSLSSCAGLSVVACPAPLVFGMAGLSFDMERQEA